MPVQYARCNWMLSLALDENGQPCRYMAQAESVQEVVDQMSHHLRTAHNVDPKALLNNIKAITKPVRAKALGTRPPGHF